MNACMQALSHFSYHASRRAILLCDLQGAVYRDRVVLTDPVVHSLDRRYGPTDMGSRGMSTFFHHHKCNLFCRPEWRWPQHTAAEFPLRIGTSMVHADGGFLRPPRLSTVAEHPYSEASELDTCAAADSDAGAGHHQEVYGGGGQGGLEPPEGEPTGRWPTRQRATASTAHACSPGPHAQPETLRARTAHTSETSTPHD